MALRVISSQSLFDTDSSKDDGGELGRLMHDFRAKEAKEMQAGALTDRVHELKETEKGVEHMCKEMEQLCDERELETKRNVAYSLAEKKMSVEDIAEVIKVNIETVKSWLASTTAALKNGTPIRLNIIKLPEKNPGKN